MVRSLTLVPVMMCAAAIVAAQAPAQPYPPAGQKPATQQPTTQQPTTQEPTTQQPTTQQPTAQQSMAANKVTYSGCVKPGTTPGSWILESADLTPATGASGQASASTSAKPGQSTVGTSGAMKTTLNLTMKSGTDLKPHTNHKVEVTGTVAAAKPGMQSSASSTQTSAQAGSASGHGMHHDFTVESVKMVSATCP